jgi:hypothetical protein
VYIALVHSILSEGLVAIVDEVINVYDKEERFVFGYFYGFLGVTDEIVTIDRHSCLSFKLTVVFGRLSVVWSLSLKLLLVDVGNVLGLDGGKGALRLIALKAFTDLRANTGGADWSRKDCRTALGVADWCCERRLNNLIFTSSNPMR